MAQVINTNVASLNAQRNLSTSQTTLATSLQRLSSGLRINSAKDDAAGLAISERFSTQIRGLNQAVRNANDGISMAQTGEGALAEIGNNLQRIRELAVQAANVTNSASDRAALDLEVQQRLAEIDRTASQTSFNGQKILNGDIGNATFQVGANVGETISVGFSTSTRITAMGKAASASSGVRLDSLITTGSDAVAGSYTKATVPGFDFTNIVAGASTYKTSAVAPGNYSTVAATAAAYKSGVVGPIDYSTIAATATTLTSGVIPPGNYSTVAATASSYQTEVIAPYAAGLTFTVQGTDGPALSVTTAGVGNDMTDLLAEITGSGSYAASGVTAALGTGAADGTIVFTSKTTGSGNVTIGGADAALVNGGVGATAGTNIDTSANKVFTVNSATGTAATITLNTNIATVAALKAAIDPQLASSGLTTSLGTGADLGKLVFTSTTTGTGAITIGGANAAFITAGSSTVAGTDTDTSANRVFTVNSANGTAATITLSSNIADAAALKAAVDGQLASSGVTTAVGTGADAGKLIFTSTTAGAGAVTIAGADSTVITTGGTAVAGANTDTSANKVFTLQGTAGTQTTITLSSVITDAASMKAAIDPQLGASGVTVSLGAGADAGKLIFTSSTTGLGDVAVGGANAALFTGAGSLATTGTAANDQRAGFDVDGNTIAFTTNLSNQAALVAEIVTQLGANAADYVVAAAGASGFSITSAVAGAATPVLVDAFTGAGTVDFSTSGTAAVAVAGTDAVAGATLTLATGDLSIQVGSGDAIAITGTFSTATELVNEINSNVQGVYASVDAATGKLDLTSAQDITLAGTAAGAGAGNLQYASMSNAAAGNLSSANTLTVSGAENLIQRIDSALETVSTLRSTFGAVQNRFESTMANLQGTAENLTAARSRIVDTDFAQETANLTRNQILQQAGIAMLAQANALPQSVLSLLK